MTGTAAAPEFVTWSAPEHAFKIQCSGVVLDEIRQTAVEGYHSVPHGGVETGGVLFGTHEPDAVRIAAWRPIACEYAYGPSFSLSDKDEAALAKTLQSWSGDAALAGLGPAGWYRAHNRSEISLSDADLAFFNRFFPQPWQVALIVRPASFAPTRAGFFFREPDGSIRTQSSYHECVLKPAVAPSLPQAPPPVAVPEPPQIVAAPEPSPVAAGTESAALPEPGPAPVVEREPPAEEALHRSKRRNWYVAGLIVLVLAAVVGFWLLRPSNRGLSLSATDVSGQLRITWDRTAGSIRHATGGLIDIDDGGLRTEVKLAPADLRSGSVFYARQSGNVAVRMTVYLPGSAPVAEISRFLRPGQVAVPPAPPHQAEAAPAQAEPQPRKTEVPPPSLPRPAPASARPVIPFRAPVAAARQSSVAVPAIAPPNIASLPASPPPGALTSVLGPVPPPPAAPALPPRQNNPAPVASGRIIWTGKLPKNGRLVLEGNRVSSGAVNGTLPAVTARVTAYPGDLTAAGITFYTADPRYSKPLTEAAGADNGWNSTTYTWDPKRAAAIRVLEQPNPQNGYKLVLESDTTKLSVVVLQWRAAQ